MVEIQYIHKKRNNQFCICPTPTVPIPVSTITKKINMAPWPLQNKYENGQVLEISEQVGKRVLTTRKWFFYHIHY